MCIALGRSLQVGAYVFQCVCVSKQINIIKYIRVFWFNVFWSNNNMIFVFLSDATDMFSHLAEAIGSSLLDPV